MSRAYFQSFRRFVFLSTLSLSLKFNRLIGNYRTRTDLNVPIAVSRSEGRLSHHICAPAQPVSELLISGSKCRPGCILQQLLRFSLVSP